MFPYSYRTTKFGIVDTRCDGLLDLALMRTEEQDSAQGDHSPLARHGQKRQARHRLGLALLGSIVTGRGL